MVQGCGMKCIKALLFIFNFIFWLSGVALAGVGIWIVVDSESFIAILDNPLIINAAYIMIGVGGFVLIVGFCGCCGAIKESRCLLGFYFTMLLLIFCAELAAGVLASIYGSDIEKYVEDAMNRTLVEDYGQTKLITDSWNDAQLIFECCGTYGYEDYLTTMWYADGQTQDFPSSCCKIISLTSGKLENEAECLNKNPAYMNPEGCVAKFKTWVDDRIYILGGVGIGVAGLQLFGMIFAICLCRSIRSSSD
ncbi:tetraspanin-18-like [Glandiceps talaboti]